MSKKSANKPTSASADQHAPQTEAADTMAEESPISGLSSAQRHLLSIQRNAGNQAAQRFLNSNRARAQRAPDPAAPTAAQSFILNEMVITTNGDLKNFYTIHQNLLLDAAKLLQKDGLEMSAGMLLLPITAQRNADQLGANTSDPVDSAHQAQAQAFFDQFQQALTDGEKTKARAAAAKLREAIAASEAAQQRIESTVMPDLRDLQRKAFRAGDENQVLKVTDALANALDTSLVLKQGILDLRAVNIDMLANELKWLGKGTPPSMKWVPKVLDFAEKLDKAYAAFQLVRAAISLASGGATSAEEGRNAVSAMSTVISAGGTLLGASTGMTLYANLYIGPMVDKCLDMLKKIEDMIADQNLKYMKEGLWNLVVWSVEPGGKETFEFMKQAMHAGSAAGIPTPIPAAVSKLFMNREDLLNAGVAKGNPMPTTGMWFWEKPDADKIGEWVFKSRRSIWTMLYGDAPVP
jgi:hypothetical protein